MKCPIVFDSFAAKVVIFLETTKLPQDIFIEMQRRKQNRNNNILKTNDGQIKTSAHRFSTSPLFPEGAILYVKILSEVC